MGDGLIHKRRLRAGALICVSSLVLAACGDPLRDVNRLSAVDIAVAEANNITVDPERERIGGPGFLGRLLGRGGGAEEPTTPETEPTDVTAVPDDALASPGEVEPENGVQVAMAEPVSDTGDTATRSDDRQRRGLFGFLRRNGGEADQTPEPEVVEAAAEVAQDTLPGGPDSETPEGGEATLAAAEASPEVETEGETEADGRREGLFSRLREARAENTPRIPTGPDAMRVAPGMAMPYGQIATNCDASRRDLGRRIERQSGFEIWDTAPGTTDQRTYFITGFEDGCARQFTGALVILGDVGTHEIVRYSNVNIDLPWSEVDNAYEEIKSRVCRVNRRQPCGARLEQLGSETAFITVYERFGSGPEWVEILLHDGAVAAIAREGI